MDITHHGAHEGVTGSCHQLHLDIKGSSSPCSVLIDCGMFQGMDAKRHQLNQQMLAVAEQEGALGYSGAGGGVNGAAGAGGGVGGASSMSSRDSSGLGFSIDDIEALVLTHCHIDHVGRVPQLITAGFSGPIYCTPATASLLPIVLSDALKLQLGHTSQQDDMIDHLVRRIQRQVIPIAYDQWFTLPFSRDQIRLRLRNAGHILGSAYAEFERIEDGFRVVFSGDLGCKNTPLLPDPTPLEYADILVLESTYGDRLHEPREHRQAKLKQVIERAFEDKGTVLIPAFSIGRTQELLYELEDLIHSNTDWAKMTVILDSPLASQYTAMYRRLRQQWDDEAKQRLADDRHPLNFERLHIVESHEQHEQLVELLRDSGTPAIVIAASGMCSGGRIVNYLKELLPDARTDLIFVGYQAEGTPGRDIQRYAEHGLGSGSSGYVVLDHQRIAINARIHTLGGYSAHADQRELVEFVQSAQRPIPDIRLVHGEPAAKRALRAVLDSFD